MTLKVAALCAGYGGLEMGLGLAGVDVELTWYAEIDKAACEVMAYHHPDIPNLGDLTQITDPPHVDLVTAGFPCQPVSVAGKRKGIEDERWLIDDVCKVARRTGAEWLLLENVAGILTANNGHALARVVSALAENGFSAEWTCIRAADVGAPHGRLRWFCLAYAENSNADLGRASGGRIPLQPRGVDFPAADADGGGHGAGQDGGRVGQVDGSDEGGTRERQWSRSAVGDRSDAATPDADCERREGALQDRNLQRGQPVSEGETVTNTDLSGCQQQRASVTKPTGDSSSECHSCVAPSPAAGPEPKEVAADTSCCRWDEGEQQSGNVSQADSERPAGFPDGHRAGATADRFGVYAEAIARWEPIVGRPAPEPVDSKGRLNPVFVEWMMGLPDGWVSSRLEARTRALKVLGNGVVPQQAAAAVRILIDQLANKANEEEK